MAFKFLSLFDVRLFVGYILLWCVPLFWWFGGHCNGYHLQSSKCSSFQCTWFHLSFFFLVWLYGIS